MQILQTSQLVPEHECYAILQAAGLPVPRHLFLPQGHTPREEQLAAFESHELVIKLVSPELAHKSEVGGVRFAANDLEEIRQTITAMESRIGERHAIDGWLLVERIEYEHDTPGHELLLSLRWDEAFGPVLTLALGGLLTEWYGDALGERGRLVLPALDFDPAEAARRWSAMLAGRLSSGRSRVHAQAPIPVELLAEFLQGFARVASDCQDMRELELNPVVRCGDRLIALDALGRRGELPSVAAPRRALGNIRRLLHPRSAVVYGASSQSFNAGRLILRKLKAAPGLDYGRLTAIHPTAERIDGVPCLRRARELPGPVDLAVVAVPADAAVAVVESLVSDQRAHSIILIPGGFTETGRPELDARLRHCLANARERHGSAPVLLGGNCLGVVSKGEYDTFFLPSYKLPMHSAPGESLAVISQSGAYSVTLSSNLDGVVYPRALISYGNEVDLGPADFLEYYLDQEPEVRIFAIYVEGLRPHDGARLRKAALRATASGRTVLVYKSGRSERGALAAASHSAALAGDYAIFSHLMRDSGAIVCDTLNMFEDYAKIFALLAERPPRGRRVAVITNAGFETSTVADRMSGLSSAELRESTREQLRAALPEIAYVGNPVDTTPMADTKSFVAAVEILARAEEVDALIVSAVPQTPLLDVLAPDLTGTHEENMFGMHSLPAELIRIFRQSEKPMLMTIDAGQLYDAPALVLERAGIPVYRKIDRASRALSALVDATQSKSALSASP